MFIVPISSAIQPVQSYFDDDTKAAAAGESTPRFSDVFKELFHEVEETQKTVQEDSVKLALGEIDDLHTIYNNMTKASVAVDTFVSVKDAAVNAYDKILQMTM